MNLPAALKELGEAYSHLNDAVADFEKAYEAVESDPEVKTAVDTVKEGMESLGQAVANVRTAISDL